MITTFVILPLALWGAADVYFLYQWIRESERGVIASTINWWTSKRNGS